MEDSSVLFADICSLEFVVGLLRAASHNIALLLYFVWLSGGLTEEESIPLQVLHGVKNLYRGDPVMGVQELPHHHTSRNALSL